MAEKVPKCTWKWSLNNNNNNNNNKILTFETKHYYNNKYNKKYKKCFKQ